MSKLKIKHISILLEEIKEDYIKIKEKLEDSYEIISNLEKDYNNLEEKYEYIPKDITQENQDKIDLIINNLDNIRLSDLEKFIEEKRI